MGLECASCFATKMTFEIRRFGQSLQDIFTGVKSCHPKREQPPSGQRAIQIVSCFSKVNHIRQRSPSLPKIVAETVATTCLDRVIWSSRVREIFLYLLLHIIQCNVFKPLWDYESAAHSNLRMQHR